MTKVESVYSEKMKAPQLNILPSGIIGSTLKDKLHFPTGHAPVQSYLLTGQAGQVEFNRVNFMFGSFCLLIPLPLC